MKGDAGDEAGGQSFFRGLRFRVAALLALSLLPLGLVMILQTRALSEEAARREELTLLSLSSSAVFGERTTIERALGATEALTEMVDALGEDVAGCRSVLARVVDRSPQFSFIGFIDMDGLMRCASAGAELDYSDDPAFLQQIADPRPLISRLDTPDISTEPVINVVQPVYVEDALRGFVSVSVPVRYTEARRDMDVDEAPLSWVTFNQKGEVLTSETLSEDAAPILPRGSDLGDLVGSPPRTFEAVDTDGMTRTFAVVPVVPGLLYALAAWPSDGGQATVAGVEIPPALLPVLMFAASIAVSYFAVDRLVVRHVGALRHMMQVFARHRTLPPRRRRDDLPTELEELETGFVEMALDLSNDEARMEDSLREKNVLLKEIHHRVKNNLQLISSIMNMQIRAARSEETVGVLRRLQERVLGLATVHRNLYQTDDLSHTDAGRLLEDLFEQLLSMSAADRKAIAYKGEFDEVILYPDQALPLSLLASELGTNALKHLDAEADGRKVLETSLRRVEGGEAELVCENSVLPGTELSETAKNGLGGRLIRAFAAQLSGELETETVGTRHRVRLRFKVESFSQTPEDY